MIKKNTLKTTSLISGALSLALVTSSSTINADKNADKNAEKIVEIQREQCAGVVKAGLNDCASAEHICAGMNTDDGNDTDWLWLPTGTCNKIIGAHTLITKKPAKPEKTDKKTG